MMPLWENVFHMRTHTHHLPIQLLHNLSPVCPDFLTHPPLPPRSQHAVTLGPHGVWCPAQLRSLEKEQLPKF